mgnify:CR=1 FL=1
MLGLGVLPDYFQVMHYFTDRSEVLKYIRWLSEVNKTVLANYDPKLSALNHPSS